MPRLRYRAPRSPSRLEERFLMLWEAAEGPPLQREFRLHEKRKWSADFAYLLGRVLIEIEGGIWVNGRHNRAAGFNADLEKYLEAWLLGWRVFRLGRIRSRWRTSSGWRCCSAKTGFTQPHRPPCEG